MTTQSLGPYIASRIHERFHAQLKQPIKLLGSKPVPIPVLRVLEQTVLISDDEIRDLLKAYVKLSANKE